jgi:hypothetical protein
LAGRADAGISQHGQSLPTCSSVCEAKKVEKSHIQVADTKPGEVSELSLKVGLSHPAALLYPKGAKYQNDNLLKWLFKKTTLRFHLITFHCKGKAS